MRSLRKLLHLSNFGNSYSVKKIRTHYDNLQVAEHASLEAIKGAYRYLSQKWHPDKNPHQRKKAERITQIINDAYAVLSDPERRRQHDEWIMEQRDIPFADQQSPTSPRIQSGSGLFRRIWFMLLFVVCGLTLVWVLPYNYFTYGFGWILVVIGVLSLGLCYYAYTSLFSPPSEKPVREQIEPDEITVKKLLNVGAMPWELLGYLFLYTAIGIFFITDTFNPIESGQLLKIAYSMGGAAAMVGIPWLIASIIAAPYRVNYAAWPSFYPIVIIVGWLIMVVPYLVSVFHQG